MAFGIAVAGGWGGVLVLVLVLVARVAHTAEQTPSVLGAIQNNMVFTVPHGKTVNLAMGPAASSPSSSSKAVTQKELTAMVRLLCAVPLTTPCNGVGVCRAPCR